MIKEDESLKTSKVAFGMVVQDAKADKEQFEWMSGASREWESTIFKAETSIALAEGGMHNFCSKFEM